MKTTFTIILGLIISGCTKGNHQQSTSRLDPTLLCINTCEMLGQQFKSITIYEIENRSICYCQVNKGREDASN